MESSYICDAVRTPFGRYGGWLAAVRPDDLAAIPLRAVLARNPSSSGPGGRYALCAMCIGVGQGIAMIVERV
jgi:acetyl-CoA acetyltransferase